MKQDIRSGILCIFSACLISTGAAGSEHLTSEFRAPPIGTVLEYSGATVTISSIKGMEVGLHVIDKEENQTYDETMYGWLVRGKVGSLRFKASAFDEMWPLAVGNQFKTQYNIATYSVALRGEVTRTEFIRGHL